MTERNKIDSNARVQDRYAMRTNCRRMPPRILICIRF